MPPHLSNFCAKILFICCHGIKYRSIPNFRPIHCLITVTRMKALPSHIQTSCTRALFTCCYDIKKFQSAILVLLFFVSVSQSCYWIPTRVLSFQCQISLILTRIFKMLQRCLAAFESLPICFGSQRSGVGTPFIGYTGRNLRKWVYF